MNSPDLRFPHSQTAAVLLASLGIILAGTACRALAEGRADILIADFEGGDYGGWKATGSAFGTRPAHGTLPGQMPVSGFEGTGLVNSFHGGDDSTGTLTSPSFVIRRPYLNFLIGGGKHPGSTCMELVVDGKPVRTATGPNDRPGGSERLEWASWDVSEFLGKSAVLRLVDRRTGGWGHINVDQIVLSDVKRGLEIVRRSIVLDGRFFLLPVKRDALPRAVRFIRGGRNLSVFEIRLPEAGQTPDFWVFIERPGMKGETFEFEARLPSDSKALDAITPSDRPPGADVLYREKDRPQFHFTARRGWLNDPNGLVWDRGQYHLFFQHNPFGWEWGNMHWGHAVSADLLHWTELPEAISPHEFGDWAFSGSAVVDHRDTAGFGRPDSLGPGGSATDPIVAAFTSTGRGECVGYYVPDASRQSFHEARENPVVKHQGRDPRLLWHKPTNRWVMAVYDELEGKQWIAFYSSPDLKRWTFESRIEGFFECPDLFELPVVGEPGRTRWVLHGADGAYVLGQFDGRKFTPDSATKHRLWYGNFYAAQTFSDTPDARRIQVGWARGVEFPGMPFNQQMTFPCELTLRTTDEGVRLFARPVSELRSLRGKHHTWRDLDLSSGDNPLASITADLLEIRAEAEVGPDAVLTLTARGVPIAFDAAKKTLTCGDKTAPLSLEGGRVRLRVLVDRGSIEVFGNDGRVAISHAIGSSRTGTKLGAAITGTAARIRALEINELNSVWR
jgi:fructan beta-fructosidase